MTLKDPQTQKVLLGGILILGLAYAFYQYLYTPRKAELADQEAVAERLERYNQSAKAAAQANRLAALEEESVSYARRLEAFEELIPTTEQVPLLLERVATAALETEVDLLTFTPLPAEPGAFYTEQFYEVEVRGGYHAIGSFLARVANLPRIIKPTITEVVGERVEPDRARARPDGESEPPVTLVRAKLQLSTYVLPGGEAAVPAGGASVPRASEPEVMGAGAEGAPPVDPSAAPAPSATNGPPALTERISPGVAPALEAERQRAAQAAAAAAARAAGDTLAGTGAAAPAPPPAAPTAAATAGVDPAPTQPAPPPPTPADLTPPGGRATDPEDRSRPGALPPLGEGTP